MVFMWSEKPICVPARLSEVSPTLPFKQFQGWSDDGPLLSFERRSSSASSFHISLLQATDGVKTPTCCNKKQTKMRPTLHSSSCSSSKMTVWRRSPDNKSSGHAVSKTSDTCRHASKFWRCLWSASLMLFLSTTTSSSLCISWNTRQHWSHSASHSNGVTPLKRPGPAVSLSSNKCVSTLFPNGLISCYLTPSYWTPTLLPFDHKSSALTPEPSPLSSLASVQAPPPVLAESYPLLWGAAAEPPPLSSLAELQSKPPSCPCRVVPTSRMSGRCPAIMGPCWLSSSAISRRRRARTS